MVDPAHNIAKNALGVIIELSLNIFGSQATDITDRGRQYVVKTGCFTFRQFMLARAHINRVIVHGM